jgi:hypothetical protein
MLRRLSIGPYLRLRRPGTFLSFHEPTSSPGRDFRPYGDVYPGFLGGIFLPCVMQFVFRGTGQHGRLQSIELWA